GADTFVFAASGNGTDTIADFNTFDGGLDEGDVFQITAADVGTFAYIGTDAFTGGGINSEARYTGARVEVDVNGDGVADILFVVTGMTAANQLATDDFLFN
ncbi:MAG: hypothetical protein ACRC14_00565, partial [Paracoccaceae bacterium]